MVPPIFNNCTCTLCTPPEVKRNRKIINKLIRNSNNCCEPPTPRSRQKVDCTLAQVRFLKKTEGSLQQKMCCPPRFSLPKPPPETTNIMMRDNCCNEKKFVCLEKKCVKKPIILVNRCKPKCESKLKLIEKWKARACLARKECERKLLLTEYQREKARASRYKRKFEENLQCMLEEEKSRNAELQRRDEEQEEMCRMADQEEMMFQKKREQFMEERLAKEDDRYFQELRDRKKEARRWREQQIAPRSKNGKSVMPEFEEMRRAMAPVDQGPNEIFEYYTVEPGTTNLSENNKTKNDSKKEKVRVPQVQFVEPQENGRASVGITKGQGIRISLGDNNARRANISVNMVPCPGIPNNFMGGVLGGVTPQNINIVNSPPPPQPQCQQAPLPLVPPELYNVMMKMADPCGGGYTPYPWQQGEESFNSGRTNYPNFSC